MATKILVVLCWLCIADCLATAPVVRERIRDIGGATVWLGMPRQEFDSLISSAGMKPLAGSADDVVFSDGSFVPFHNGKLQLASREWYFLNGRLDAFESTLAAIGSVADTYGLSHCSISHDPIADPKMQSDRVFILCGQRSFLLGETRAGTRTAYSVAERIGEGISHFRSW